MYSYLHMNCFYLIKIVSLVDILQSQGYENVYVTRRCLVFSANSRQSVAGSSSIRSSSSPGDVQYHLKPPVSAINMEHKVIKLTSSKTTSSSSSSRDAGNMQNSHHLKQLSASESSIVSNTSGDSSSTSSRKIRLCQPGHASAAEKPQQHQTVGVVTASTLPAKRTSGDAGETEKKKFKATAITWP